MNITCNHDCAYKDICKIQNVAECHVYADKPAQEFKKATILGRDTKELLNM